MNSPSIYRRGTLNGCQLVKRTNCLGNQGNANYNEMLFYIYEDDEMEMFESKSIKNDMEKQALS